NWSAIAQQAFRAEVLSRAVRKEPNDMTNVVERLRASKQQHEKSAFEAGQQAGEQWAKGTAEDDGVSRREGFDGRQTDADVETVQVLIDPQGNMARDDWHSFWTSDDDEAPPSNAYARGFLAGAVKVFREVEHQL